VEGIDRDRLLASLRDRDYVNFSNYLVTNAEISYHRSSNR
jgi:hypothetical protein